MLSLGWENILEGDEPQVGQLHEDVDRKREYYHIIIFPERKKRTSKNHSNGTLFEKSLPANKQPILFVHQNQMIPVKLI